MIKVVGYFFMSSVNWSPCGNNDVPIKLNVFYTESVGFCIALLHYESIS